MEPPTPKSNADFRRLLATPARSSNDGDSRFRRLSGKPGRMYPTHFCFIFISFIGSVAWANVLRLIADTSDLGGSAASSVASEQAKKNKAYKHKQYEIFIYLSREINK